MFHLVRSQLLHMVAYCGYAVLLVFQLLQLEHLLLALYRLTTLLCLSDIFEVQLEELLLFFQLVHLRAFDFQKLLFALLVAAENLVTHLVKLLEGLVFSLLGQVFLVLDALANSLRNVIHFFVLKLKLPFSLIHLVSVCV